MEAHSGLLRGGISAITRPGVNAGRTRLPIVPARKNASMSHPVTSHGSGWLLIDGPGSRGRTVNSGRSVWAGHRRGEHCHRVDGRSPLPGPARQTTSGDAPPEGASPGGAHALARRYPRSPALQPRVLCKISSPLSCVFRPRVGPGLCDEIKAVSDCRADQSQPEFARSLPEVCPRFARGLPDADLNSPAGMRG